MKTLNDLYDEILKSKDLQKKFGESLKNKKLLEFLREHGCDVTLDDLKVFLENKFSKEGKIDDTELEKIIGGLGWWYIEQLIPSMVINHNI